MSFKKKAYRQLVKQTRGIEYSFEQARGLIRSHGGEILNYPKNVPRTWRAKIIHHFGIKLFNPQNPSEYVKIFPPNHRTKNPVFHKFHVIYHQPNEGIPSTLQRFDRNKHRQLLIDFMAKYPDKQTRLKNAKDQLDFSYTKEDIAYVREMLQFPPLSMQVLEIIEMKTCSCHAITFSNSQGGVMFRHVKGGDNPGFSIRAAHHLTRPPPFVKVSTADGYHGIDGENYPQNQTATHIRINEILNYPMSWYLPPCQSVFEMSEFDYWLVQRQSEEFDDNASAVGMDSLKGPRP